jgi:hypothetical protein
MPPQPVVVTECGRQRGERGIHRLLGIFIVSVLSALFWIGLAAAIGAALGRPLGLLALATIAAAITTFLFAVGRTLIDRLPSR